MDCRVRAMQISSSERAVTKGVAGHRAAPQRLRASSSSKFRQSRFVWCSPREAIQLPRHHTRRLDRGFEVWVMMCAPEERLDAAPTGHGVGVEDAESEREDCERRQGVCDGRAGAARPCARLFHVCSCTRPFHGKQNTASGTTPALSDATKHISTTHMTTTATPDPLLLP